MQKRSHFRLKLGLCILCVIAVGGSFCLGKELEKRRLEEVGDWFTNDKETVLPQTIVHKVVDDFLNSPMAAGKKEKKVLVIGYDGVRRDALDSLIGKEDSAIHVVGEKGGIYATFAGGILGKNEQETTTAPGWAAILTGGWSDYSGVGHSSDPLNLGVDTWLEMAAEQGYHCGFISSWKEHFEYAYAADVNEAVYKNMNPIYIQTHDDESILDIVTRSFGEYDQDVIFAIFEGPDEAGHTFGYGSDIPEYENAIREVDEMTYNILNEIENRESYDEEDWLILITTDHGGKEKTHGGQSVEERGTWLVSNRKIEVTQEALEYAK